MSRGLKTTLVLAAVLFGSLLTALAQNPTPVVVTQHVDVGGHTLYIDCAGTGSPTVILDSGLGVSSGTWFDVQRQLRGETRVCRYDRAGLGNSQMGPMPRNSEVIVDELHTLLTNAGIEPPYILVGASFGGVNMRLYASLYPDEVVGMVMVDSTHPDLDARLEALLSPEQIDERRADLGANPEGITFDDILTSDDQVRGIDLPDVPMIVLVHGIPFVPPEETSYPGAELEALWMELSEDIASEVTNSEIIVAERSGHRIAERQPELVAEAIRTVIALAAAEATPEPEG